MLELNYIDLLGKGFKYNGRGPDEYDCYGLVKEIYHRIGVELPEYASTDNCSLINQMIEQGKELFTKIEKPEPFCIVLFQIIPGYVSHIGVVLGDCIKFIHISQGISVAVERLDNKLWERRNRGYYKWIN